MKWAPYAAIPLGLLMLFSVVLVPFDGAFAQKKTATDITLDEFPGKVRPGYMVTLTGMVTADGEPVPDLPVNIYVLTSDPKLIVVASGVTGIEGTYEIVWDVKLIPQEKAFTDVTQKIHTQVMSMFAQFDGDDQYMASKTKKSTVTIEVNSITTFVSTDKKEYREGETATVFIGFVDSDDKFVDPDSINAHFNLDSIADKLEKKKEGSYTFVTPPLDKRYNQVTIVPAKEGYNIEVEAVTITVLSKSSAGKFGGF